ncbi:hypothetical protein BH11PSE11_BH11PSE11_20720 [soil metagenome]
MAHMTTRNSSRHGVWIIGVVMLAGVFSMAAQAADRPTAPSEEQRALHVLNRLAFGPRPGDVERVAKMGVDQYIKTQLDAAAIPLPQPLIARLDSLDAEGDKAGDTLGDLLEARREAKADPETGKQKQRQTVQRIAQQTAEARIIRAIDSPRQLQEVMVDFWFNHFNVFAGKGLDRALVSSYERDAIRPHVFGSFRELLGAATKHPAMLFYLDNWLSTSAEFRPKLSPGAAKNNAPRGLNENHARELMELHTLGVDGGYTQKDVTELARMLTG